MSNPEDPRELTTALKIALSIVSGTLFFLSCADFDIWPLCWIAGVPLLWVTQHPSEKRPWLWGLLAGTVANGGGFGELAGRHRLHVLRGLVKRAGAELRPFVADLVGALRCGGGCFELRAELARLRTVGLQEAAHAERHVVFATRFLAALRDDHDAADHAERQDEPDDAKRRARGGVH